MSKSFESAIELISKRVSWRKFTKKSLSSFHREKLADFIKTLEPGPFGHGNRFLLFSEQDEESYRTLGSYGVIRGATDYLAGAVKKGEGILEDFGFQMELALLKATELGIGSCWLGGSFTKKSFAKAISLQNDEVIPAVIALGNPTDKRGMVDSLIRLGAKSKSRKSFDLLFSWEELGQKIDPGYQLYQALEMVRLAPSASNQQPWRIIASSSAVHFYLKRSERYQKTLKRFGLVDLQRIDMGIALAHFELAAKELQFEGYFSKDGARSSDISTCGEYVISWFLNHK